MSDLFAKNLACITPDLQQALKEVAGTAHDEFCRLRSRSGLPVTGTVVDGRNRMFHSTYDPRKEARRLASGVESETVIVLGFGTGHHLAPLLSRVSHLIVVEPNLASVAHAFHQLDLTSVLSDHRLHLLVGLEGPRLSQRIAHEYLPTIHGSAAVVGLPGRVQASPEAFAAVQEELRVGLDAVSADFAIQARFGRAWSRNTIHNLEYLTGSGADDAEGRPDAPPRLEYPDLTGRSVIITAAGPSLNDALDLIAADTKSVIVATDTSLPTLAAAGISPTAVVTVDCQPVSYLHYLTAGFPETLLLADLAAPPAVFRNFRRVGPLVSPHPLHRLLMRSGGKLLEFDSSGGNVTHAAVSVAESLGARVIRVVGADFCYPGGDGYARGSYVDAYFGALANRTRPVSSSLFGFVRKRPGLYRDAGQPGTFRQPALDRYRSALAGRIEQMQVPVIMGSEDLEPGGGAHQRSRATQSASSRENAAIPRIEVPAAMMDRLRSQLLRLDDPAGKLAFWSDRWNSPEVGGDDSARAVIAALLPYVAWLRRYDAESSAGDLLESAHRETMELFGQSAVS